MSDEPLFTIGGHIGEEEHAVNELITSLGTLTPAQKVKAQLCRSLARSISEGNRKGRSVAADVERLAALVHDLTGDDDENTDGFTPEEKALFDGLATPPAWLSPTEIRDPA